MTRTEHECLERRVERRALFLGRRGAKVAQHRTERVRAGGDRRGGRLPAERGAAVGSMVGVDELIDERGRNDCNEQRGHEQHDAPTTRPPY